MTVVLIALALLATSTAFGTSLGTVRLKYSHAAPRRAAYTYLDGHRSGPYVVGQYNLLLDAGYDEPGEDEADVLLDNAAATGYYIGSFCADVRQTAPGSFRLYDIYDPSDAPVGGANTPMGDDKAADLRKLFDLYSGSVATNNGAAAFQACVWEIICETSGTYDVLRGSADAGNFYMQEYWGSGWLTTANGWLDVVSSTAEDPVDIGLRVLVNEDTQDYALTIPGLGGIPVIPEPLTMLGVFGGIAGLGGYVRRRQGA